MASVAINPSEGGVASVALSLRERGVVKMSTIQVKETWPLCPSFSERGMASVAVTTSERGVAVPVAWSLCLHIPMKEVWLCV